MRFSLTGIRLLRVSLGSCNLDCFGNTAMLTVAPFPLELPAQSVIFIASSLYENQLVIWSMWRSRAFWVLIYRTNVSTTAESKQVRRGPSCL